MASVRTRVNIPLSKFSLPNTVLGRGEISADFVSFNDLNDNDEHIALVFGEADSQASPLIRIHSECLTGDVFHSARCDCGAQLQESIDLMNQYNGNKKTGGIILYLRQEGRGIGLYNKLDAYKLQDQGMDTYEANRHLGFENDLRNFKVAAEMLLSLNVQKVQVLSNNPKKVNSLKANGIDVSEFKQTGVFSTAHNEKYLQAKVDVEAHKIELSKAR
jgi:GTP cyclohydrolase II